MAEQQPLNAGQPPPYSAPPAEPPKMSYAPAPAALGTTTTVITQPVVVQQNLRLGEFPVTVMCPSGGHQITTNVHYESGTMTWILAAVLCLVLGPLCAWIPFVINDTKDVIHTCPIDGTIIGTYKRM